MPTGAGGADLGGVSLVPVFRDSSATVRSVALSQFPRCWQVTIVIKLGMGCKAMLLIALAEQHRL